MSQSELLPVLKVLNGYLHALDAGEAAAAADCFEEDAHADYDGAPPLQSRAEILAFLLDSGVSSRARWAASTHSLANWRIEFDGADALADCMVEAVLADTPRGSGRIVRRGLRYQDELVFREGSWLIRRRRHSLLWSCELSGEVRR